DLRVLSAADVRSARDYCVEDGLKIGRRRADDPKNLRSRCLLLERFSDLCVCLSQGSILLLQLREEAHVLDRDHRLVGEGLEELDLAFGERTHFASANEEGPDGKTPTQEGSAEHRTPAAPAGDISPDWEVVGFCHILDVDNPRLVHCISRDGAPDWLAVADKRRQGAMVRMGYEFVAVDSPQDGVGRAAHNPRVPHDRIEDWLIVT